MNAKLPMWELGRPEPGGLSAGLCVCACRCLPSGCALSLHARQAPRQVELDGSHHSRVRSSEVLPQLVDSSIARPTLDRDLARRREDSRESY